ncbi:unnamed protein product, partial [Mesorhabditis belari]|uniref:Major facilitator superfamily (MFS) profile domain-containing protein n=1 Tax=Mesorhabditis belari TaxID=2138241 RepID=A0AAF3E7Z3_9BILA
MSGNLPRSLNDVWEPSKNLFNEYKQPISNFFSKDDKQKLENEGEGVLDSYQAQGHEKTSHKASTTETFAFEDDRRDAKRPNRILMFFEQYKIMNWRKRWQLAILANIGFLIVFGIRCNLGAAKNHMFRNYTDPYGHKHMHDFNWTTTELEVMESSFFYGYLITQIPAGFLAAKFPPNRLFGLGVGMVSLLNFLLPFGFNSKSDFLVVIMQILQGLFQGIAYPSMHGVWRYWAPPLERSKLATTAFTGSYAGAVLGIPVSAFLVAYVNWSAPFYLYGVVGCIWTIFWFALTFEKPANHPTISLEERKYIEESLGHVSYKMPTLASIPWKAMLTSKPVWAIIVANFARSWTFYLLLQNQLTYMRDVFGLKMNESGLLAALPHLVMGIVVLLGGQLADYLRTNKILSTTAVRKIFNCGGFGGEAFFMLFVAYTRKESIAVICLILAVGSSGFAISGYNVNHLDIAPRYAAILMGFSNGVGTLAGLFCPIITEILTSRGSHGWTTVFLLASMIHFTGITFYGVFASGELQDWAEPKEEEESWNESNLGQRAVGNPNYGSTTTAANEPTTSAPPRPQQPAQNRTDDSRGGYDPMNPDW